jgi:hypothetical protein
MKGEDDREARGPSTTRTRTRLMTAHMCAALGTTSSTAVHRRACVRAGKRTAVCPTGDWQLAVTGSTSAESGGSSTASSEEPSRVVPSRVVPLSVAALSVALMSVVRAGEHDAERCRRA